MSATAQQRPAMLFTWLLIIGVVVSVWSLASWVFQAPVSFDGAMNLQVSDSLAHGGGFRRSYAEQTLFPPEIETKLPFILPAAMIYRVLGVGIFSSQLASFLYFLFLLAAIFCLVRSGLSERSPAWAWSAVLLCAITPGLLQFGFSGYGEVPALAWFLWGCFFLFRRIDELPRGGRLLGAAIVLGLAAATKVVLLIGVFAACLTFIGLLLATRPMNWRRFIVDLLVLGSGLVIALLPQELMHLAAAGPAGFVTWWADHFNDIATQAGVKSGMPDTANPVAKWLAHFTMLAKHHAVPSWHLALMFLGGTGLTLGALVRARGTIAFRFLSVIGVATTIYFLWWLLLTPTSKAWPRRIFDGVLLFQLLVPLSLGVLVRPGMFRRLWISGALVLLAALAVALPNVQYVARFARMAPSRLRPNPEAADLSTVVNWLRTMPGDAPLFGEEWYAAPQIGLYAQRPIRDLSDWLPVRHPETREIFLLVDAPALHADAFHNPLDRYEAEKLFPKLVWYQVYRVDLDRERPLFAKIADHSKVKSSVDFMKGDYALLMGFNERAGPGRWMRCRGDALLQYGGEAYAFVEGHLPPEGRYYYPDGMTLVVKVKGQPLAREHIDRPGRFSFRWPVSGLGLSAGAEVTFSLTCDNFLVTRDLRQLSVVLRSFGFAGAEK